MDRYKFVSGFWFSLADSQTVIVKQNNLSPGVGTGRQAGLRSQCSLSERGGSNPLLGTEY